MTDDDEIIDAEIVDDTGSELVPVDAGVESAGPPALDPVLELRRGLVALDEQRAELAKAGDYESLAIGAADIAAITGDLRDIERAARSDIAVIVKAGWVDPETGKPKKGKPKVTVEGLGTVEIEGGWTRKNWESEQLLRRLMMLAIVDDDGELLVGSPTAIVDAIYDVLADCLPITGSLQWRVGSLDKATQQLTGLKKYGIVDEEWCDKIDNPVLAKVPKRQGSA